MKKIFSKLTLSVFLLNSILFPASLQANNLNNIVINEIAWAGTSDSSSDEWIELYNNSSSSVDLTGWKIIDDNTSEYLLSGTVDAFSYFLIEDTEQATSTNADLIIPISLANSGDSLSLVDPNNNEIDIVNGNGGAWFAGSSGTYGSMERISPSVSGDSPDNWQTSEFQNSIIARNGSPIIGTPRSANSNTLQESIVSLALDNSNPSPNQEVSLSLSVENIQNLYSYGFELTYDPTVLSYVDSSSSTLLSQDNAVQTSFQSSLENNQQGKLLIAESRLMEQNKSGISSNGTLFQSTFSVIGDPGSNTSITIQPQSFLADPNDDLLASFQNTSLTIELNVVNPVQNLSVQESEQRYSLDLNWEQPINNADQYKILKKNHLGEFIELQTTDQLTFQDSSNLVPNLTYEYQVVAIKQNQESDPITVQGQETRGLKGDNDRSDRVDGRDLQNLAQKFALNHQNQDFDFLIDTNYDGLIDGSDLLDLSQNFGLTF